MDLCRVRLVRAHLNHLPQVRRRDLSLRQHLAIAGRVHCQHQRSLMPLFPPHRDRRARRVLLELRP